VLSSAQFTAFYSAEKAFCANSPSTLFMAERFKKSFARQDKHAAAA